MRRPRRVALLAVALAASSCSNSENQGPQVITLAVTPDSLFLARGDSVQLTVSVFDQNGAPATGASVTFHSGDAAIVYVTNLGMVHTGTSTGATAITVSAGGAHRDIPAKVFAIPHMLTLAPADTTIREGGSYSLRAKVYDTFGDSIPGAPVTFHSADTTVAKVSVTGVVTGVGAGTVNLSASSGVALAHASLTVQDTNIVARVPLTGSPFGAAANHQGVAYVLRAGLNAAARFNLPDSTVVANVGLGNGPTFITFDSAGTTAYETAQLGGRVDVIDVATNSVTDSILTTGNPFVVRVSPDDKSVWVSTNVDSLYQFDRSTKSVLARYGVPLVPNGIAFAPNNDSLLYVSTQTAGKVVEINYKKQTIGRTFTPGGTTQAVVIAPDGSKLYVANEVLQEIEVYDLSTGSALTPVSTGGTVFDLELSPDGTSLWASNTSVAGGVGDVRIYDRASGSLLRKFATGGEPRRIALTPATSVVIIANDYGWVDFVK